MKKNHDSRKKLILELMRDPHYVPMKLKEIAILMQVSAQDRPEFDEIIIELLEENEIEVNKRGKYSLAKERELEGIFTSNARGFGFVTCENRPEDLFIPENEIHGALHGDTVRVKLIKGKKGKRQEASVIKVIERANTEIVGTFEKQKKNYGFVVPDNSKILNDIFVEACNENGAKDGMKVVVKLTKYYENKNPEGVITEVLGYMDEAGVDMLSIIKTYGMETEFDPRVLEQANRIAKPVSDADRAFRTDLRDMMMVTIDGEDAKDLDDAVSLEIEGENYLLGVHIADVTNYVQENSALDKEALKRGTSVYLPDRVLPMLPKELSNGCCSLNQHEDRLALSCLMTIDKKGKVLASRVEKTVINVNRRMSYNEVKKLLAGTDDALAQECSELLPMLKEMEVLSKLLRKNRFKKGSIDFDFPETKIILDENGKVLELKPYEHNVATQLIEEFMLQANCCVAESFFYQELPFVYRIHEKPDPEKVKELARFVAGFGFTIKGNRDEIHPKEIQKLLENVEGTESEALIARITLRSMQKAKYSPECTGHFGLAFERYCHFTSPIRRYPDLQIHRIIKEQISGKLNDKRIEHYNSILTSVSKRASEREIAAAECEREAVKLKKVQYMQEHIGEEFDGVVSGVTNWGVYVELPDTVEGMVPIASIQGDYYRYSERDYSLIGETTGRVYALGQKVRVKCVRSDMYTRTIDFEFVDFKEK